MAQLICKNVTLGYDGVAVLEDLNFQVNQGDYLCIIGENGTGKTTLMKAILGLRKQMLGEISWSDGVATNEIGYLTQQSEIQREFPASVKEVVFSGFQSKCGLRPFYKKEEKQLATQIMEKLGVDVFAGKCYRELSGGQQQRVLLARALCATQKILFLDEPVTGLDPKVSVEMYDVFQRLNQEDGVTIIMISHDVQTSLEYATHILQIGETIFFGTKEEYVAKLNAEGMCACGCSH
ncbi:metal ABC transporter ATP-binding protein [Chakrabartyella piscis]|uniref:metal ABC transporter ATP-binding protein n=1 Tax=Chakrabartyella piscis TaxID=2918914 RepID=UPI0029586DA6|nr:metal ABC transporter ATP-binding protein [Chakrabartyella piscis]